MPPQQPPPPTPPPTHTHPHHHHHHHPNTHTHTAGPIPPSAWRQTPYTSNNWMPPPEPPTAGPTQQRPPPTFVCRSFTSSSPTISPRPRTSPMMSCLPCSRLRDGKGRREEQEGEDQHINGAKQVSSNAQPKAATPPAAALDSCAAGCRPRCSLPATQYPSPQRSAQCRART